jgi:hypothetical protein
MTRRYKGRHGRAASGRSGLVLDQPSQRQLHGNGMVVGITPMPYHHAGMDVMHLCRRNFWK